MEDWESPLKNVNRGYRKLTVWQDAIAYYRVTCPMFRSFPYELKRVASNQIAAADSIHRNIALASAGESVSGLHAYHAAGQLSKPDFDKADAVAYKLENGLKRLIESLEQKRDAGEWDESFVVRESNAAYQAGRGDDE